MPNLAGSSVNASGTLIATAKALGNGQLDTTNAKHDNHTVIQYGKQSITVKQAINMGILQRNAAGVLVELNGPQPATKVTK